MPQFRKRPVVIEASQFNQDMADGKSELLPGIGVDHTDSPEWFFVVTIHGQKTKVIPGDWIITEPDGKHFYPCKPGIFMATYEPVVNEEPASDPSIE